ncbi:MAG: oligoendopeptidase F [Rubrivivax sp.]|nr:oligoendopeptidase F [Rubrivivax sp.]
MSTRLARHQVAIDTTWDLTDLYPDDATWEAGFRAVDDALQALPAWQGRLAEGAGTLLACLEALDAAQVLLVRVSSYARLRNAQDGSDAANQAAMARVAALHARFDAATSFVESEIVAFPDGLLERYQATEPGLAAFAVLLSDLLAQRPHHLGADAERVLAALGEVLDAPLAVYSRAKAGDFRFEPFTDEAGQVYVNSVNAYESAYESHADASVRRAAWASFSAGLKAHHQTSGALFATEVSKNVALARLRRFESTESYLLQWHKVPLSVYRDILEIIQSEGAAHMRRLARLRRRVLGLDRLLMCDLKAPLDPAYHPRMGWDESCALVLDALAVMGPEYVDLARRTLERRWVDRADNIGKSSGAFCASPYGVHPYILITWSDTMRNVFTLAHELGHGGHFGLAMQHQRLANLRPAMPFIEAPSTLNETLLAQHLFARSTDRRLRRSVILQVLGTYHHNFVTHLLEAELQRQVYARAEAGGSITAAVLDDMKGGILQRYWGDTVEIDDGARMTWMRQPHYYMGLYPYTYSVGLVASTAMAQRIRDEGAPAVQRWLEVLKAGGTMPPLELLRHAGVDLSTPQPIHDAVAYVGRLVDELEASFD